MAVFPRWLGGCFTLSDWWLSSLVGLVAVFSLLALLAFGCGNLVCWGGPLDHPKHKNLTPKSKKKQETKKAKQQLSWKYLHIKWAKPGVLDSFVHEYSTQYKIDKIKFLDWVKKKYDPIKLEKNFRSIWWVNRLLDDVLKRE